MRSNDGPASFEVVKHGEADDDKRHVGLTEFVQITGATAPLSLAAFTE
jgi:hypothetical protein